MNSRWTLLPLLLLAVAWPQPARSGEPRKPGESSPKLHPDVHKNHVRRASAEYLGAYRRIRWHYDFATASKLARETGRPMFVIFCRAGTIGDPRSGKPKCAS
jgi:hypothetical protein